MAASESIMGSGELGGARAEPQPPTGHVIPAVPTASPRAVRRRDKRFRNSALDQGHFVRLCRVHGGRHRSGPPATERPINRRHGETVSRVDVSLEGEPVHRLVNDDGGNAAVPLDRLNELLGTGELDGGHSVGR